LKAQEPISAARPRAPEIALRRHARALRGAALALPPVSGHAAVLIDSFESGAFSLFVSTNGTDSSVQNPNSAHCIANQRSVLLDGAQTTATLSPLQNVDDAIRIDVNAAIDSELFLEYDGGPWDLTESGANNRISVSVAVNFIDSPPSTTWRRCLWASTRAAIHSASG
jgi:hypothetical protein